ncbi:MAG: hypothetical protein KAT00_09545 [Planctomycetes bacterium]|nr:hypothetical protein [Planctomycetota bacterium]
MTPDEEKKALLRETRKIRRYVGRVYRTATREKWKLHSCDSVGNLYFLRYPKGKRLYLLPPIEGVECLRNLEKHPEIEEVTKTTT